MNVIFNFSTVEKIVEFFKKAEKLFEANEGKATADVDSDCLSINFLYKNGEFISSKFIPDSFDPEKVLKKLNLLGLKYSLKLFGWKMPFKFNLFSLKLLGYHLLDIHSFISNVNNVLLLFSSVCF